MLISSFVAVLFLLFIDWANTELIAMVSKTNSMMILIVLIIILVFESTAALAALITGDILLIIAKLYYSINKRAP